MIESHVFLKRKKKSDKWKSIHLWCSWTCLWKFWCIWYWWVSSFHTTWRFIGYSFYRCLWRNDGIPVQSTTITKRIYRIIIKNRYLIFLTIPLRNIGKNFPIKQAWVHQNFIFVTPTLIIHQSLLLIRSSILKYNKLPKFLSVLKRL